MKGIQTAGRLWKHSTLADAEGLITREDMRDLFTFTLVVIRGTAWSVITTGCKPKRLTILP